MYRLKLPGRIGRVSEEDLYEGLEFIKYPKYKLHIEISTKQYEQRVKLAKYLYEEIMSRSESHYLLEKIYVLYIELIEENCEEEIKSYISEYLETLKSPEGILQVNEKKLYGGVELAKHPLHKHCIGCSTKKYERRIEVAKCLYNEILEEYCDKRISKCQFMKLYKLYLELVEEEYEDQLKLVVFEYFKMSKLLQIGKVDEEEQYGELAEFVNYPWYKLRIESFIKEYKCKIKFAKERLDKLLSKQPKIYKSSDEDKTLGYNDSVKQQYEEEVELAEEKYRKQVKLIILEFLEELKLSSEISEINEKELNERLEFIKCPLYKECIKCIFKEYKEKVEAARNLKKEFNKGKCRAELYLSLSKLYKLYLELCTEKYQEEAEISISAYLKKLKLTKDSEQTSNKKMDGLEFIENYYYRWFVDYVAKEHKEKVQVAKKLCEVMLSSEQDRKISDRSETKELTKLYELYLELAKERYEKQVIKHVSKYLDELKLGERIYQVNKGKLKDEKLYEGLPYSDVNEGFFEYSKMAYDSLVYMCEGIYRMALGNKIRKEEYKKEDSIKQAEERFKQQERYRDIKEHLIDPEVFGL